MMAQRIQTVCDVHLDRGEDVDGVTWQVLVRPAGTRTQTREIDLCPECAAVLESVAAFAREHGRTQAVDGPRPRAAVTPAAVGTVPTTKADSSGMASCPVEGCGSVVLAQNLARHVRRQHDQTTAPVLNQCPDCDRVFTTPQGLGAHRHQRHGYRAASRDAAPVDGAELAAS